MAKESERIKKEIQKLDKKLGKGPNVKANEHWSKLNMDYSLAKAREHKW